MSLVSLLLGRRLASSEQKKTKIGVIAGVAAMGLDGLASSAYGPEAALAILAPLGIAGPRYILPVMLGILLVLSLLYLSYLQTTEAYPVNGGSYTVAKENLGVWPSLLAAAALMIDYVLTVAVGISAGVAALVSAVPMLHPYTLALCLGILGLITVMNLRGTAEAGRAFALPTYIFIFTLGLTLVVGTVKTILSAGHPRAVISPPALPGAIGAVSLWLLLRAFASGCTAMTGLEAVSNGVSAFEKPNVPNAQRTLTIIVGVLILLLIGIAGLCWAYGIGTMNQEQAGYQSVLSQITQAVVGRNWFYYLTIAGVLAVLCLSANTSFVDFPRLCRIIAKDNFLPPAFAVAGRRLVYSVGIVFLAGSAAALLLVFRGITDRLIPLFAVGAFLAFTLSQSGMVVHWRHRLRGAQGQTAVASVRVRLWINGVGAAGTWFALAIILTTKFVAGAWITLLAIPCLLGLFQFVHRYYRKVEGEIYTWRPLDLGHSDPPVVLIPIKEWNRLTAKGLRFAMWVSTDVVALHLSNLEGDAAKEQEARIRQDWARAVEAPTRQAGLPPPRLVVARSPYRQFVEPILKQIDLLEKEFPSRLIAVIAPGIVPLHWWQVLLHSRKTARLRSALLHRGDKQVIVVSMPWYLNE